MLRPLFLCCVSEIRTHGDLRSLKSLSPKSLPADRPCTRSEGAVIGIPAVDPNRGRLAKEPREKRQLLRCVRDAIENHRWERGSAQWVTILKVILTACNLSDVSPRRG